MKIITFFFLLLLLHFSCLNLAIFSLFLLSDVWLEGDNISEEFDGTLALTLQMAYILNQTDIWRSHTALRVIGVVDNRSEVSIHADMLQNLLRTARISALIEVTALSDVKLESFNQFPDSNPPRLREMTLKQRSIVMNELLRQHPETCNFAFTKL